MSKFDYKCKVETKTICNDESIYPAMKDLVEKQKIDVNEAAEFIFKDSEGAVTKDRALGVYKRRTKSPSPTPPTGSGSKFKGMYSKKGGKTEAETPPEPNAEELTKTNEEIIDINQWGEDIVKCIKITTDYMNKEYSDISKKDQLIIDKSMALIHKFVLFYVKKKKGK